MPDFQKSLAPWIGLVAIVAFAGLVYYLLGHLAAPGEEWTRAVYIYGGVEAVAFSSFGYFFGKEVHRERADNAESRAKTAENDAKEADGAKKVAETNLSALNTLIQTKKALRAPRSLSDLLAVHLAREPEIETQLPGLTSYIAAKRERPIMVASDPDWEELASVAERLATR